MMIQAPTMPAHCAPLNSVAVDVIAIAPRVVVNQGAMFPRPNSTWWMAVSKLDVLVMGLI